MFMSKKKFNEEITRYYESGIDTGIKRTITNVSRYADESLRSENKALKAKLEELGLRLADISREKLERHDYSAKIKLLEEADKMKYHGLTEKVKTLEADVEYYKNRARMLEKDDVFL